MGSGTTQIKIDGIPAKDFVRDRLQSASTVDFTKNLNAVLRDIDIFYNQRRRKPKSHILKAFVDALIESIPKKSPITEVPLDKSVRRIPQDQGKVCLSEDTLALMKEDERTVILMFANGYSYQQVATKLDISKSLVRDIWVRARKEYYRLLTNASQPLMDRFMERKNK